MTELADLFAPFALNVRAGDLELRALTDEDLVLLGGLALKGIHEPGKMPFYFPWTEVPASDLARNTAQFHWRQRANFTPDAWSLDLGVWRAGELIGCQGVTTRNFLTTRTGETGSWLGMAYQGQGIGTAMRQAMCALLFDHLDFAEITSAAFADNPASLAVSRKVGYRPNGLRRTVRRHDELALEQSLVLIPETFVRGEPIDVSGVERLRAAIGM